MHHQHKLVAVVRFEKFVSKQFVLNTFKKINVFFYILFFLPILIDLQFLLQSVDLSKEHFQWRFFDLSHISTFADIALR